MTKEEKLAKIAEAMQPQRAIREEARERERESLAESLPKIRAAAAERREANSPQRDWYGMLEKEKSCTWQDELKLTDRDQ
jgi:hypothetical protein